MQIYPDEKKYYFISQHFNVIIEPGDLTNVTR